MAFDALTVRAMVKECKNILVGSRTEKIYQSEKDEIMIGFRTKEGTRKLLISVGADFPRITLTRATRENPEKPPMFCMLLRKHLGGAKLQDIEQVGFERVVDLTFSCYDELGDFGVKHLMVEIMGRFSNVIFTDDTGKIIDSLKHIDCLTSSVREVLPGLMYKLPPAQDEKINPMEATAEDFMNVAAKRSENVKLSKYLLANVLGISPLIAREIAFRAAQNDLMAKDETYANSAVRDALLQIFEIVKLEKSCAYIIEDKTDGRMIDFAPVPIGQYGDGAELLSFDSLSDACEAFYEKKDAFVRLRQKSANLTHTVNNFIERCHKKILLQESTLKEAENKEECREFADLIMANIGNMSKGARTFTTRNFYDIEEKEVCIPLDESLSPVQNAQRYYKKYNKLKVAQIEQEKQIKMAKEDLAYLEEVAAFIERAQGMQDLLQIRAELEREGYLKKTIIRGKNKKNAGTKPAKMEFMKFISSDGYDIYVGKNSTQNDALTTKVANSSDLWFHTKNIPGSHTVIKFGVNKEVTEQTIVEAAHIAAYYSKACGSAQIPVDYTQIKNVKKPNGAKPGMVIYDHYRTIYVKSDEDLVKRLEK